MNPTGRVPGCNGRRDLVPATGEIRLRLAHGGGGRPGGGSGGSGSGRGEEGEGFKQWD